MGQSFADPVIMLEHKKHPIIFTFLNSELDSTVGLAGLVLAMLRTTAPSSTVYRSDCAKKKFVKQILNLMYVSNSRIDTSDTDEKITSRIITIDCLKKSNSSEVKIPGQAANLKLP